MLDRPVNRFIFAGSLLVGLTVISMSAFGAGELSGVVTAVSGDVKLRVGAKSTPAHVGLKVNEKDHLQTGPGGMVQVRYSDGNSFTVYEKASVKVSEYRLSQSKTLSSSIDVAYGKLRFFVNPKGDTKKNVKFRSKAAVMGIRGTSGIISVEPGGRTQLHVISGRVEVFNPQLPNLKIPVNALTMTRLEPAEAPAPPVAVSAEVMNGLVPQAPKGGAFSDDSAQASATYSATPDSGASDRAPATRESEQGNNESNGSDKTQEKEDLNEGGAQERESNEQQSSPQGSGQNSTPPKERESASQPAQPEKRMRPKVTVFKPGGGVAQPELTSERNLNSISPSVEREESDNRAGSQLGTGETVASDGATPLSTSSGAIKALERVATELEQISTKTEQSLERVKSVETAPTPERRLIKIKVPMPAK